MKDFKNSPLWVIAFFMVVAESVFGVVISQTSGVAQTVVLSFFIFYTLFVTASFFLFLWFRPLHFYGPDVYGSDVTPEEYARVFSLLPQSTINAVKENPNNDNALFEVASSFLNDKDTQHLILMLKNDGILNFKSKNDKGEKAFHYTAILKSGSIIGGLFEVKPFINALSGTKFLLPVKDEGLVKLSNQGKAFAKWLISKDLDAETFQSDLGNFGIQQDINKFFTARFVEARPAF